MKDWIDDLKILIMIIFMLVLAGTLAVGAAYRENAIENSDSSEIVAASSEVYFKMELVGTDGAFKYYRDAVTDQMFVQYNTGHSMYCYASGLTPMEEPETGLPLTYTRYTELCKLNSPEVNEVS